MFSIMITCLYLVYPDVLDTVGNVMLAKTITGTFGVILFLFYKFFISPSVIEADQVYTKRWFEMGSDANYNGQSAGKRWTPSGVIKSKMAAPIEKSIELDYFRFLPKVKRHLYIKWFWEKMESQPLILNPEYLTQGSLVIGQSGAGKTEFFHSIIMQSEHKKLFKRMIIHDTKGDITAAWFRKNKDIIVNPYDVRGATWDFFGEANVEVVEQFFSTYLAATSGEKKDFFSGSAQERFMQIIKQFFYKKGYSSKEKWGAFLDALETFFDDVANGDQRSEKDIVSTMKLTFEFFALQNQLIQEGGKTFTFKSFFESEDVKLILHNPPSHVSRLSSYFAAIVASMTIVLASLDSKKWDKKNQTFLLFDEYLTFLNVLEESTVKTLHTLIRSKGGSLMAAVQYIPEHSGTKNIHQSLSNSAWAWFIFRTTDNSTKRLINQNIEKVEYQKSSLSASVVMSGSTGYSNRGNLSTQTAEIDLIDGDTLSNLGWDHLTYIPSKDILYRGYTPQVKMPKRSKDIVLRPDSFYEEFYENLYSNKKKIQ